MLREMDGLDTVQICEALRISQNNLWVMFHRARMALRECLELTWFGRKPGACPLAYRLADNGGVAGFKMRRRHGA
jgi:hypothetical protein